MPCTIDTILLGMSVWIGMNNCCNVVAANDHGLGWIGQHMKR